ncbi:MAG: type 4a pilus biogenesis protein PilO [Candidatus Omnitrophica bacterium]|nr:type 4a pilus biogenesis protein PilO [Candidatus Omnitrophota bacterium]
MAGITSIFKNMPQLELDESKKKILLFYGVGLLVLFAVYIFVFLSPSIARLFSLIPEVRVLRMEMKAVYDDLGFEAKLKERSKTLQDKLGGYEEKLSREKELPILFGNISKMARSSRVKILSITPLEVRKRETNDKKESVYEELPIAISAQSGYHELGEFISKMENDKRYLQVSDIKIKSNTANPRKHDINFVVYAYTFKSGE